VSTIKINALATGGLPFPSPIPVPRQEVKKGLYLTSPPPPLMRTSL